MILPKVKVMAYHNLETRIRPLEIWCYATNKGKLLMISHSPRKEKIWFTCIAYSYKYATSPSYGYWPLTLENVESLISQ